ncbi:MAG: phosphatase PAP2 family protein [Eubacterium sp.]
MTTKKKSLPIVIISVIFYAVAVMLMIYGSYNDLELDKRLFNPQNGFAMVFEGFGQAVAWAMWGPIFTVLFLTAHGLNECLEIIGKILPFIKPVNTENAKFQKLDKAVKIVWQVVFFVLAVIGWKKLIENVAKKFFDIEQVVYFIICAVVTALAIYLFSKIDKRILVKLEALALAGILFGILYKIVENCKEITQRVRFRELVAASNGIYDDKGLSHGKPSKLTSSLSRDMLAGSHFNAFTKWYEPGKGSMNIYSNVDSFPSGHTLNACAAFMSVLFCSAFERLKKFAPIALIVSFIYVFIMGYTRLILGAHYLTDVVAGAIIGYTFFLFTAAIYKLFFKKGILPTRSTN